MTQVVSERSAATRPLWVAAAVAVAAVVVLPNVRVAMRHDALLARTDTRAVLTEVLRELPLASDEPEAFVGSFVWGALPRDAGWEVRDSIAGSEAAILDSFSHDPYLYHAPTRPVEMQPPAWPETIAFQELRSLPALVISPYDRARELVPFSPESAYSPFFPDLPFRTRPGPFIELYLPDDALLDDALATCARHPLRCRTVKAGEGYFVREGTAGGSGGRSNGVLR